MPFVFVVLKYLDKPEELACSFFTVFQRNEVFHGAQRLSFSFCIRRTYMYFLEKIEEHFSPLENFKPGSLFKTSMQVVVRK